MTTQYFDMSIMSFLMLIYLIYTVIYIFSLFFCFINRRVDHARQRLVWPLGCSICALTHGGIISICIFDLVLSRKQDLGYCWAIYASLISTSVASFASVVAVVFGYAQAWHALYTLSGASAWGALCLFESSSNSLTLMIPILFLITHITILGAPYKVIPDGTLEHPLTRTAFLPSITLTWLDPLLKKATRSPISEDDLWPVDENLGRLYDPRGADAALNRWPFLLQKGLANVLFLEYTGLLISSGVLALVSILSTFAQPFLLGALLGQRRFIFVVGLFVSDIIGGAARAHSHYQLRTVGMRLRTTLTAQICDKNLEVVSTGGSGADALVLMEVDLQQVFALVEIFHNTYIAPLQCLVSFAALAYILGWQSVLVGCTVMVICVPLFVYLMSIVFWRMSRVMLAKDMRVQLINEMLAQIRQIKLHGWQPYVQSKIDASRVHELGEVGRVALVNSFQVAISSMMPTGLVAITLATYVAMGSQLTSQIMFPALAFFFNINSGLQAINQLVMIYQGAVISWDRIRNHLVLSDLHTRPEQHAPISEVPSIVVKNATLSTPGLGTEPRVLLLNINFEAATKGLTVVSGPLGSGKSTFLRSLIRDVRQVDGSIQLSGTVAYSPQVPVLIHGTLQDNILFGLPLDLSFYERVIDAAVLGFDLSTLAHGDQTMLGGTGAALSGGQKSRIALARAMYSRRDIVVLDDPMAALDPGVRKEVVRQAFGPEGLLRDRICIVTSSCEPLIEVADTIYTIVDRQLVQGSRLREGASLAGSEPESASIGDEVSAKPILFAATSSQTGCGTFSVKSIEPVVLSVHDSDISEELPLLARQPGETPTGVPLRTYVSYLRLANKGGWYIVILLAVITKVADVVALLFLKKASEGAAGFDMLLYFTGLSTAGAVGAFAFVMVAYFLCLIPSSRRLHDHLTQGVLGAKFAFFDENTPGQILSRFTNDMNKVDSQLNAGLIRFVMAGVMALSPILVILFAAPLSLVYLIPLGLLYHSVQTYYLNAYRQLRQLENGTRERIINAAEEIRTSVSVIRCFDQAILFQKRARSAIDSHVVVWGPFLALSIWLELRLQLVASLVTLLSATLLLSLDTPSSMLGLVMNFVLQITNVLNSLLEVRAGLEADITSYERIQMFAGMPSEGDAHIGVEPPLDWPSNGTIVFDSYSASYSPGGKLCLKSIDLKIAGGEHVAIVGRTGAGKSSIVLALLRAIDKACVQGSIRVDGLDLSSLKLAMIRRRIALIPQEPGVISGTLRENLDPLGETDDVTLREALTACQVAKVLNITSDKDPLEHRISGSRSKFSIGQLQILALARAVATKSKIIILDEATASIDTDTAIAMQQVLKSSFKGCTMISITHDMDSAKRYDRIITMNHGFVVDQA